MRRRTPSSTDFDTQSPFTRAWQAGAALFRAFAPFAVILVALLLIKGPEMQSRSVTARLDLLLVTYPLGAFLTGWLFGLLSPRTRWLPGAVLTGLVAFAPWTVGISLALDRGYAHWGPRNTLVTAVTTVLLGGASGFALWSAKRRSIS